MSRTIAWTRWVRGRGGGKRAAGVLAAVGVEGRVATSEGRRCAVDRELDRRHEGRPVVDILAGEGAQDVGDEAVDAPCFAGGVMMMWRAVDERGAQPHVHRARPQGAGEARVRDEHLGQPHLAGHRPDEVARRLLCGGGLEGRDQPHAPGQEVYAHCSPAESRGRSGRRPGQLQEVEADVPTATRGRGELYSRPAGDGHPLMESGRPAWSALARWQVRTYPSSAAGRPGHHTKRRARAQSACPAEGRAARAGAALVEVRQVRKGGRRAG